MMRATSFILILLLPISASAQEPLTLREAVQQSLSTHPSLAQAEAVAARAAAARREQQSSLLPALSADATLTQFQEPMVVKPLHGFDPRQPPQFDRTLTQGSLTLGYTLWDGGARGARLDRASAQIDAARAGQESAQSMVIAETVRRYAVLQHIRELVKAHSAMVQALTSEHGRATQLLEQGRAARVVVLRAAAASSRAQAELASVQAQLEVAERELARVMGIAPASLQARVLSNVVLQATSADRDAAVQQALSSNPELRRLRAQVSAADANEAEARASWWPRVLLGGRYQHYASGLGDAGGEWQGGVQLSYAIFTAGARPAGQDRARAEHRQVTAELALAELRLAEAIDRAHAELTAARARSAALAAAIAQSEEVVRIEQLALSQGAGVQTDYLSAEAELLRARAQLAEARTSELVAWVELARAQGVLTPAWIEQSVETAR